MAHWHFGTVTTLWCYGTFTLWDSNYIVMLWHINTMGQELHCDVMAHSHYGTVTTL